MATLALPYNGVAVMAVPTKRKWAISVPAGFPVFVSIDSITTGGAKRTLESALLQPSTVRVFQSNDNDLFLSGASTDPNADITPTVITFIDSGSAP